MFPALYNFSSAHLSHSPSANSTPQRSNNLPISTKNSFHPHFAATTTFDVRTQKWTELKQHLNGDSDKKRLAAKFILDNFQDDERDELLHSLARNPDQDIRKGLINVLFPCYSKQFEESVSQITEQLRIQLTKKLVETSQKHRETWEAVSNKLSLNLDLCLGEQSEALTHFVDLWDFVLIKLAQDDAYQMRLSALNGFDTLQRYDFRLSDAATEIIRSLKNDLNDSVAELAKRFFPEI